MLLDEMAAPTRRNSRLIAGAAAALLLVALVGAVFAVTVRNGFVTLDDKRYIYENPQVLRGLGWETALWALRSTENANWYPLRRLTHLVDVSLFGLWAGGHHLVSVAWHAAAAVLLFLALWLMTGGAGRSFLVAALFAGHPLQVESVAWAAERSNVLAGFFFGLTLLLWARYVRLPGRGRYAAVALSLSLGLMAKPILVSVPLLLLLLDVWPLCRMHGPGAPPWRPARDRYWRCLLEKAPLLALAAASGAIAVVVHRRAGALERLEALPLSARLDNALVSYWRYLAKMLWPAGLAVHYPHPGRDLSTGMVVLAAIGLAALTAAALAQVRRRPWLAAGWLWFLVTLAPMIGIVQFGSHAMADRFAYLACVGCFVAAIWLGAEALRSLHAPPSAGVAAAAIALAALAAATAAQAAFWRDSRTLYEHALAVTAGNHVAHNNLGSLLAREGRGDEAIAHFAEAVRLRPEWGKPRVNLGEALLRRGEAAEALRQFQTALLLLPEEPAVHDFLGQALMALGRPREASARFAAALRLQPAYAGARERLRRAEAAARQSPQGR